MRYRFDFDMIRLLGCLYFGKLKIKFLDFNNMDGVYCSGVLVYLTLPGLLNLV